jgi:hypothetical protein
LLLQLLHAVLLVALHSGGEGERAAQAEVSEGDDHRLPAAIGFDVADDAPFIAGHDMLKARGVTLIAASAPMHFVEDTPTAVLVRQVLGAVAEFEKTTPVAKLAAARRRKRMVTGNKVEGRKSHAEVRPVVVKLAKALARKKPKGGALSLRAISAALAEQGHLNERGRPFNPKSVAAMLTARGH